MSTQAPITNDAAMQIAVEHADLAKGSTYPHPPTGAVIVDTAGQLAAAAGTPPDGKTHAVVSALRHAGRRAAGGTAVLTLEPCDNHGSTTPCVDDLLAAGITTVAYAVGDPANTAGATNRLTAAGIQVLTDVQSQLVTKGPLREWLHKQRTGSPHLTWKYAASIDGRSAAADRSSQWITSAPARADVHRRRAELDAIMVGTGTVLTDNPTLTARLPDGSLADHQPLRVVVGKRDIPTDANILNDDAPTMVIRTHDPAEVLAALSGRTHVLLEGGPTLAGAFLRAAKIDRILAYVAPILLGGPITAVDDVGVPNISHALRWRYDAITPLDPDLLLSLVPTDRDATAHPAS